MDILLIGSGVIGSVYGAQFALAGHRLWVLQHSEREAEVARDGIKIHDKEKNKSETAQVQPASSADERTYNLVVIAVQADQLPATFDTLRKLKGHPHLLFFGNNPDGHKLLPADLPGTVQLAFPGISGKIVNNVVEYIRISQQSTTLEKVQVALNKQIVSLFESHGFKVEEVRNIDGWLAYHAVFISCIATALTQAGMQPQELANNRQLLKLMCQAIEEGFRALRRQGITGLPLNLRVLHHPLLRLVAINYWHNIMHTKGEAYFAAHIRHADKEMQTLGLWTLSKVKNSSSVEHLRKLLAIPTIHT